ncbi:MAG: HAD family hydrolase [Lachnospiraceae bacterium]
MKKAVIFDLDGTLTDSLDSIAYCTNQALAVYGLAPFERDRYRYFVGDGAEELLKRVLLADGDTDLTYYDRIKASYHDIFERDCMYHVVPYRGIPETLDALRKKQIRIAVLSNKPHARTQDVIHAVFGEGVFDIIQGQTPKIARKPSPEGVFLIAKEWGLTPKEIIYLGDTDTDMQTGTQAGAYTIGALWGFRDRAELEANHADAILTQPEELLNYFI